MYSNASQKVTFRSVKRHLLPARTFPPAESGADTALQGGSLRPAEGRKTIYTPAARPRRAAPQAAHRHQRRRKAHSPPCRLSVTAAPRRARMPAIMTAPPCAEGAGAAERHAEPGAREEELRAERGKGELPITRFRTAGDGERWVGRRGKEGWEHKKRATAITAIAPYI